MQWRDGKYSKRKDHHEQPCYCCRDQAELPMKCLAHDEDQQSQGQFVKVKHFA
jgi:hypothetical protein